MIIEDLTINNFVEQVENDKTWLNEVVNHKGKLYGHTAKMKSGRLRMFIVENSKAFQAMQEYIKLREDALKEINFNDHTKPIPGQIDMFSEEE